MTKKTDGTIDVSTRERVPFGAHRRRLAVHKKDPNYVYRWFNDVEDRIQRAKAAGYTFCTNEEVGEIGDTDVHNGSNSTDSRVSKRLRAFTVYLMKIKREYWEADQKAKDLEADAIDETIFRGGADKVPHSYGLRVDYRR